MKRIIVVFITFFNLFFCVSYSKAQLSGTLTVPATYTSLATVINALNTFTLSGPVTVEISSGYTEVVPYGGYNLTAKTSSINTITFLKSGTGANPLLFAYSGGTSTPTSNFHDGFWRFLGTDYITIESIDLIDTNSVNPSTMEFGYGFFKTDSTNGCQYNVIRNCVITLNRNNDQSGGSKGIEFANATSLMHNNSILITNPKATHSYNKIYGNFIQNCNIGISFTGYNAASQVLGDKGNDIGGNSILTGNSIINYGGGLSGNGFPMAISCYAQWDLNISYNLINNNNGSGFNHPNSITGIYFASPISANTIVNNNTVTVRGGGVGANVYGIHDAFIFGGTATGTVDITNNTITNCEFSSVATGTFCGIFENSEHRELNINNNILLNNLSIANGGKYYSICGFGIGSWRQRLNNNVINGVGINSSNTNLEYRGIFTNSSSTTTTLSISGNSIQAVNYLDSSQANFTFIYNAAWVSAKVNIDSNKVINLSIPSKARTELIHNESQSANQSISYNSIIGTFLNQVSGGIFFGIYDNGSSNGGSLTVKGNSFTRMSLMRTHSFKCVAVNLSGTRFGLIDSNIVDSVFCGPMSINNNVCFELQNNGSSSFLVEKNGIRSIISSGGIEGIRVIGTNSGSVIAISTNTISGLVSNNGVNTTGISIIGGNSANLFKNRIIDLRSNGDMVNGVVCGAGVFNIYNNLIGDLKAPITNNPFAISGINLTSTASNTRYNIYNNSIYINSTSSGNNFGSTAIYHSDNFNSDGLLQLNNNVLVNISTPNGSGKTCALYRTMNNRGNYSDSSNNNLYHVGFGPNRYHYNDGPLYSTFTAFKVGVAPRESSSVTEMPPFISVLGSNLNYLNISTTLTTQIESGGKPMPGLVDDYIGTTRNPLTPDIGAWEGNFLLPVDVFENGFFNEFSAFPIPFTDLLLVKSSVECEMIILNAIGEEVFRCKGNKGINQIQTERFASGIYLINVINLSNGSKSTSKVIKQ